MKTLTQYQCEICNAVYSEEGKCEACEASHVGVTEVIGYRYNTYDNNGKYPVAVTVKTADGKTLTFKR